MTIDVVVSCPAALSWVVLRFLEGGCVDSRRLFSEDELRGSRTLGIVREDMAASRRSYASWTETKTMQMQNNARNANAL